jgi:high-affinity iron transporter
METFVQGLIVAFREGLEAFLVIVILLKFLERTNNGLLKKSVWKGLFTGVGFSVAFGAVLVWLSSFIGSLDTAAKLWESAASLIAVILIATFIKWMIDHGSRIKRHIENQAELNLTKKGIFLVSFFMVAREGTEIALFQFAGKYAMLSIALGILLSVIVVWLIYHSLVKIELRTIFAVTLAYLILQAGFLLGYSAHEGLSAAKDMGHIGKDSPIYTKAFDLSNTAWDHKVGTMGIPLYVAVGWYSRQEWIQFVLQYALTLSFFGYWYIRETKKAGKSQKA